MFSDTSLLSSSRASLLKTSVFIPPLTTTALSFFEPMTAPEPPLPAALWVSFMTQAMRDMFSPAGPMRAALILSPCFSLSQFSVAEVVLPHISEASRI